MNTFKTLTDGINFQLPICLHNWGRGVEFLKFNQKGGGFMFFPQKGRSWRNRGDYFKKERVSLIFILSKPFQCYLSLSAWCVFVWCVLFVYTISVSILCVSRQGRSLIESNQQICGFYKGVIFEKQRHCVK